MNNQEVDVSAAGSPLGRRGRYLVLAAAFLGWMFAGWEMSLLPLAARAATIGMLAEDDEHTTWVRQAQAAGSVEQAASTEDRAAVERLDRVVGEWFARYIAAFLLGAALGGWVFGWYGDRAGRVRAMGLSILWYSGFTGLAYFANTPPQLAVMRFVACMGIGGMWPAGVSLVSEAWPDVSRPTLAGLIGTSANVGIALLGVVVRVTGDLFPDYQLTADSWRWIMLVGAVPAILGVLVLWLVPESPQWLARRPAPESVGERERPIRRILRPPLLKYTIAGTALGAIPLLGAWGAQKWIIPWAGQVGSEMGNEGLKADTQTVWAIGAALGSLCGGWLATWLGRRTCYFLVSLGSLLLAGIIFRGLDPSEGWWFLGPVFLLGLVATVYFGWLPLYLPELFPTPVRASGLGVSFNSGRIVSALLVFATVPLVAAYDGDYARVGATTSLIYVAGMIVILLVPRTRASLAEESLS